MSIRGNFGWLFKEKFKNCEIIGEIIEKPEGKIILKHS